MKRIANSPPVLPNLPRRKFLEGLALGGIVLGLTPWESSFAVQPAAQAAPVHAGTEFDLTIAQTLVNFTGNPRLATTVNGSIPSPTLRWREGDTVTIRVTNRLAEDTSIHWHGILLPFQMDGVPGISFKGIAPGETFTYRFKVMQAGTYWYHSHSGMQEQLGMYGAIIIDPAGSDPIRSDRDYVVQLSDWTDENPVRVMEKLKMQSDYYNYNQPTAVDFFRDVVREGLSEALDKRQMWNQMRMSPTDLADISAYTYTYLMNGTAPAGNWTGLFRPGEKVRLRFINSGAMTFFDVRIPGLKSMDRTVYARGTLAVRAGMTAAIPALDKAEPLSMGDMMGDMGGGVAVRHAKTEYGPSVDMRVDTPRTNLDDPGIGLRYNGRRVLNYADLHSLSGIMDRPVADMEIELHLTGNMERYAWSLDGLNSVNPHRYTSPMANAYA